MSENQKIKDKINKSLSKLATYHDHVPLGEICQIVKDNGCLVVDEEGNEWSGILCGENSSADFTIKGLKNVGMHLMWYKMPSGRFEITVYLS